MKILKNKFGLFSLFILSAISVFFYSCGPDKLTETISVEDSIALLDIEKKYVLPHGIAYNEGNVLDYLSKADNFTLEKLNKNYRVSKFLVEQNLYAKISSFLNDGDNIADVNFEMYFDESQSTELEEYLNNFSEKMESRSNSCYKVTITQYNGGWCTYFYEGTSNCFICPCPYFEYLSPC